MSWQSFCKRHRLNLDHESGSSGGVLTDKQCECFHFGPGEIPFGAFPRQARIRNPCLVTVVGTSVGERGARAGSESAEQVLVPS